MSDYKQVQILVRCTPEDGKIVPTLPFARGFGPMTLEQVWKVVGKLETLFEGGLRHPLFTGKIEGSEAMSDIHGHVKRARELAKMDLDYWGDLELRIEARELLHLLAEARWKSDARYTTNIKEMARRLVTAKRERHAAQARVEALERENERLRRVADVARKVVEGDPALSGYFADEGHVFLRDVLAALAPPPTEQKEGHR